MRKRSIITLCLVLISFVLPISVDYGEGDEAEKDALQSYLSIYEIEKELARIEVEEQQIYLDLQQLEDQIEQQKEQMVSFQKHAGEIARAYYTGDRLDLLLLALKSSNFSELLEVYDYLAYILLNDQKMLVDFQQELENLNTLIVKKEDRLVELDELRAHLLAQKELLAVVESKLAEAMAGVSDTEKVIALQEQLVADWETRGIPTFELFLQTISASMQDMALAFQKNIAITLTGTKLTITDQEFTDFLKEKSPIFEGFQITFEPDTLAFFGDYEGMALTIKGSYQLESEEKVSFRIDQLMYNGFVLPDSTAKELQEKYDLGIYPKQIYQGLRVKEITLTKGKLEIVFSLSFS